MAEPDPLSEIEFLARSANRIEVLAALVDQPHTRQELAERVGVSQPTLGRILRDLSDRHWVRTDGTTYEATGTGRLVATGIMDLRNRLETELELRDVIEWLPTDALDVGLEHFAGATITTPTETRPNAPIQRMLELLGETDCARLLSHAFNEQKLRLIRDRSVDGDLTTKGVFGESAIDAIAERPDLRALLGEIVQADSAEIRVSTAEIPVAVEITDERTHLLLRDSDGIVRAALDTDDTTIRAWAENLHDQYWQTATTVNPDRFLS